MEGTETLCKMCRLKEKKENETKRIKKHRVV